MKRGGRQQVYGRKKHPFLYTRSMRDRPLWQRTCLHCGLPLRDRTFHDGRTIERLTVTLK